MRKQGVGNDDEYSRLRHTKSSAIMSTVLSPHEHNLHEASKEGYTLYTCVKSSPLPAFAAKRHKRAGISSRFTGQTGRRGHDTPVASAILIRVKR